MATRSRSAGLAGAEAALRAHALAKPESSEHFPWGERAIKVKGKVFLFMRADATQLSLSTKLPESSPVALMLPFTQPTGYGLGKAGWVSATFDAGQGPPPVEMLCSWIDESYQAVAPAKLAALARGAAAAAAPSPMPTPAGQATPARKPKPAPSGRSAGPGTPKAAARKPTRTATRVATRPGSTSARPSRRKPAR